jgi:hypothetical protein
LSFAPILIIEIDVCGIFFTDGDECHERALLRCGKSVRWERGGSIAFWEIGEVEWGPANYADLISRDLWFDRNIRAETAVGNTR